MKTLRYINYWGTWRRWVRDLPGNLMLEVEITPINHHIPAYYKDMGERLYVSDRLSNRTVNNSIDPIICARDFPPDYLAAMIKHLGADKAARLMTYDYGQDFDLVKYRKANNGGAQYDLCRK